MSVALSSQATDWREGRRLRAWELSQAGWSQSKIAEALGVTPGAVSQWMRRVREGGGPEALRRRKAPGAKCRLGESDRVRLLELLRQGAEAHGFKGELWTRRRIAVLSAREFGVRYHRSKAMRQFLGEGAATRIHLERFPGYAPELDPEEGIWCHLKRVEMRNLCCGELPELRHEFRAACQRLRQKPRVIEGCLQHSGLV